MTRYGGREAETLKAICSVQTVMGREEICPEVGLVQVLGLNQPCSWNQSKNQRTCAARFSTQTRPVKDLGILPV